MNPHEQKHLLRKEIIHPTACIAAIIDKVRTIIKSAKVWNQEDLINLNSRKTYRDENLKLLVSIRLIK